jgi:murein DD-endopeptidase MepM/ murein hydrolase activator NlpD
LFLLACLALGIVACWQQVRLYKKDHAITKLIVENKALKEEMMAIDGQLAELKDQASDVRVFQKELIKVIKDIDQKYPVNLIPYQGNHTSTHAEKDSHDLSNKIWKLASMESDLRTKSANLLGQAAFMRDVLSNTPSLMPVGIGYISSNFGLRKDPFSKRYIRHNGIDIAAPLGTEVYASADGKIKIASRSISFGNYVEIEHLNGYSTSYAHLSAMLVGKNQLVKRGQPIGLVGKTGTRCQGSHVHFEVKKNGILQNPAPYLITRPASYL